MQNYDNQMENEELMLSLTAGPSKCLAAVVVLYRSLGFKKDLAIFCMNELSRRRKLGDDFNYENFIEEELNKIPKVQNLNLNMLSYDISSGIIGAANLIKLNA